MLKRSFLYIFILVLAFVGIFISLRKGQELEASHSSRQWLSMGTVAAFDFYGEGEADAADIVKGAFEEVSRELSLFDSESALFCLNRDGALSFDFSSRTNFLFVLSVAMEVARSSGGAFDPTINPLMRLWGFRKGVVEAELPSKDLLQSALGKVGYQYISIATNQANCVEVRFLRPGMELDFGGIAKGYAVDLAYERLVMAGFTDFLINLGGNIRVCGVPSQGRSTWSIAIRDPASPDRTTGEIIELRSGEAVATSGSYERYVVIDGKEYSHIIDPRTGLPVERTDSVTVIAPSAILADALSTARFVNGEGAIRISSESN